jgi:uncharacterized protein (TIGR02217 family)
VRTISYLDQLTAIFHAVRGAAHAFRIKDWADYRSGPALAAPAPTDQVLGTGDGANKVFQLVKRYTAGALETVRPIRKPLPGTVQVAKDGVPQASGWSVATSTGLVTFTTAPAAGVIVSAGFEFDLPARFESDELPQALECYQIGSISVAVIEVRGE